VLGFLWIGSLVAVAMHCLNWWLSNVQRR
jgi:hypothetical protein